ncbi:MAG: hypothetical protein NUV59_00425 [Patescibacteria group bacterium]|nr:hypothetical protein [Patescibacteria group bacterium]
MTIGRMVAVLFALIAALLALAFFSTYQREGSPPPGMRACTMEAKQCPDGSYVGRTRPNCEFAVCPPADGGGREVPSGSLSPERIEARIGQGASAMGVKVIPLEILEDSRCPSDVTCIWAGRVRLLAELQSASGTAEREFILGQPVATGAVSITLIAVYPDTLSTVSIGQGDYRFVFELWRKDK